MQVPKELPTGIQERVTKQGETRYRWVINTKSNPNLFGKWGHFLDIAIQERIAMLRQIELNGGKLPTVAVRDKLDDKVSVIINRYIEEVKPNPNEVSRLRLFNRHPVSNKTLRELHREDVRAYVNERKKQVTSKGTLVTARTIGRDITAIRHIFNYAKVEWKGYEDLQNPFAKLGLKGTNHARHRRLLDGEHEALMKAFSECDSIENRVFLPLAYYFAIQTGMRLQEIMNLRWKDINLKDRTIFILKRKCHPHGQTIVLPGSTYLMLERIYSLAVQHTRELVEQGNPENAEVFLTEFTDNIHSNTRIFPKTKRAIQQAWDRARIRANIKPDGRNEILEFRDLRREADHRFEEADLTTGQQAAMMGHDSANDVPSVYRNSPTLRKIAEKLDRYEFNGKTLEEVLKARKEYLHRRELGLAKDEVGTGFEALYAYPIQYIRSTQKVVPLRIKLAKVS
jgi:integrase